ncbi:MAG: hypothetical protein Q8R67_05230 [Rhodoferax sp.]|nr:hypothetical protein [Rhodoferax sp.]MDP3651069.1 hypothetical protein [Rhodoferax sp.]
MQTTQQQPADRQSLVKTWQTHLRFNGREPRTLYELGVAVADHQHRQRLADLKAIAKKLELIDALLPALDAQGIHIAGREMYSLDSGKTIKITNYVYPDDKLHQALLALGFREVERKELYTGARTDHAALKQGRLTISIEVSKLPTAKPATEVAA